MKCSLSTGGDQDYIELTPETLQEASQLALIATSKFVGPNRMYLDFSGHLTDNPMKLCVFVSEKRPRNTAKEAEARQAMDATP